MTLIELLVALTAGIAVMAAITTAMVVTIHETDRVTTHIESNQQARLAMTKIVNQLHSACVAPQIAPVRAESTGSVLTFVHQVGSQVVPVPILSQISLKGEILQQVDYPAIAGTGPNWKFETARPSAPEVLMNGVNPISETRPIFQYFAYRNGAVSSTPLTVPFRENAEAAKAIQVNIAFQIHPFAPTATDENAETQIQDSVLFRLSAPSYNASTADIPCQ